ncbi:ATP-dependent helicase [Thermocrinis albus]|uniref:ATP-dependent helicase n=1 Tax=Thermocrinis albus TaxID=136094 RepID=UPI0002D326EC|nr:3'-5' exonuclease [Thermocrinis albus]
MVKLEINYRSGGYIVQVANAVVASSEVAWKDLVPVLVSAKGEGSKPVVRRFEREDEEASWIANKIKELSPSYPLSRIAILVRTSYVTEAIERALFSARIPYKVVGTLRFFERAEVKDVLSPFMILANRSNSVAFRRFLQAFSQNLGDKSWEKIQAFYKGDWIEASQMALKHLRPSAAQSLHHLIVLLRILQKNIEDYPTALENFLDAVGYMEDLSEERRKNVQELLLYLKARKREGYSWEDVVEEVTLLSGEEEEQDAVRIMTIHASKGLEFDVVFLPRLEEGILPHEKSIEEDRLEEERRLFYVGITRARELLFMSYTREKSKPSRFLSCIPKNLLDLSAFVKKEKGQLTWRAGQKVQHRVFGIGHVVRVEGPRVIVRFKDGEKSIYSAFLEPVE